MIKTCPYSNMVSNPLSVCLCVFFPTCQVRVSRFYQSCFCLLLPPSPPAVMPSTASSRAQWALPDLNGERQMSVGTARPQRGAPDLSGHCRTPTARARCPWALPDLSQTPERMSNTRIMRDRLPERMSG